MNKRDGQRLSLKTEMRLHECTNQTLLCRSAAMRSHAKRTNAPCIYDHMCESPTDRIYTIKVRAPFSPARSPKHSKKKLDCACVHIFYTCFACCASHIHFGTTTHNSCNFSRISSKNEFAHTRAHCQKRCTHTDASANGNSRIDKSPQCQE